MSFSHIKKVELHTHLDCSLSYDLVKKNLPEINIKIFKEKFTGNGCKNLNDYLKCIERSLDLMQNEENLNLVVVDFFDQLKRDNVIYVEIRFAPLLHLREGLDPVQVVEIILNKCKCESQKSNIKFGLILCTLRHFSESQSLETVKLIKELADEMIVGFDLAADEAGYSLENHITAFEYAKKNNIKCTAHAGEAKGYKSVIETLEKLKPARIGHGVRSNESSDLLSRLKKEKIHLEICPTSNLVTGVYDDIKKHPINDLYNKKFSISVNSDGRTISNTSLNKEYKKLSETFDWKEQHFLNCNLNAIRSSFANEKTKRDIILQLKNQ